MTVADLVATTPNPYPDEEKALNAALAKAQGEFPQIHKNKTATVRMKAGGTYTYTYADLADILAAVRPVLAKHGLALIQRLEHTGGQPAIRTELRHTEGAVIAASFPIGTTNGTPQELGSLLTYLRRYALTAMLGIAAEDDNDAQDVASAAPQTPVAEASPFQPPDVRQEPLVEDLTSAQRKTIYAIKTKLTDAGLFDDDQFRSALVQAYEVDSVSGLSKDQASELIGRLKASEADLDKEKP